MREALDVSGTECITVAVRRERLIDAAGKNLLDFIDATPLHDLAQHGRLFHGRRCGARGPPGPRNSYADEQSRRRLGEARSAGRHQDPAARPHRHAGRPPRKLVAEGFQVLVYTSDDPVVAKRLKAAGATSVMPAGSPIGSGQGVLNPNAIRICLEYLKDGDPDYPVIVDAGVGTASDVTTAMELGVDGVLLNTGIAHAKDPLADGPRDAAGVRVGPAWPIWPAAFRRSFTPRPAARPKGRLPRRSRLGGQAFLSKRKGVRTILCSPELPIIVLTPFCSPNASPHHLDPHPHPWQGLDRRRPPVDTNALAGIASAGNSHPRYDRRPDNVRRSKSWRCRA